MKKIDRIDNKSIIIMDKLCDDETWTLTNKDKEVIQEFLDKYVALYSAYEEETYFSEKRAKAIKMLNETVRKLE